MFNNPGFLTYLQGQGFAGEGRPEMREYIQQLRAQGQHPRMDYWQSQQGLGGLAQGWQGHGMGGNQPAFAQPGMQHSPRPQIPGNQSWGQPPHVMGPQVQPGPNMQHQGIAQGEPMGLAGLSRMRPMKFGTR